MKTVAIAAVATLCLSVSSVSGMESFLAKLPNGSKFAKALGHSGTSGYTAFGTAFLEAGTTWSADFCKQTFPGSSITNGEAFGDPCCVWKSGAAPKSVNAFTTNPGAGVGKCEAAGATKPPSAPTTAPSRPNPAPNATPKPNNAPKPNPNPAPRPNPAPKPTSKKPAKNCKRNLRK